MKRTAEKRSTAYGQITMDIGLVSFVMKFMDTAEQIREELEHFDRELADSIKPLAIIIDGFDADGQGNINNKDPSLYEQNAAQNFNFVYERVVDKISQLNFYKGIEKMDTKQKKK